MDKVIHFEIPVDDLERAKNFYKTVFGWGLTSVPEMEYTLIQTVEVDEATQMPKEAGAINGGMMQRTELWKNPIITVHVEDIDAAMKQILGLGGKSFVYHSPRNSCGWSKVMEDLIDVTGHQLTIYMGRATNNRGKASPRGMCCLMGEPKTGNLWGTGISVERSWYCSSDQMVGEASAGFQDGDDHAGISILSFVVTHEEGYEKCCSGLCYR